LKGSNLYRVFKQDLRDTRIESKNYKAPQGHECKAATASSSLAPNRGQGRAVANPAKSPASRKLGARLMLGVESGEGGGHVQRLTLGGSRRQRPGTGVNAGGSFASSPARQGGGAGLCSGRRRTGGGEAGGALGRRRRGRLPFYGAGVGRQTRGRRRRAGPGLWPGMAAGWAPPGHAAGPARAGRGELGRASGLGLVR
jgi:hypothetical protein